MLDDLALFVRIIESGSLRAAAAGEAVPAATVTRRLQKLEQTLGCQLLHRSARRLVPTQEGLQYYEQCRPLLQALQQTTQSLDTNLNQLAGVVRVLAPINLANGPLQTCWSGFMLRYPAIRLELQLNNHNEDLIDTGADLALRAGPQSDSGFAQRRLGMVRHAVVASPGYLAGSPRLNTPQDLIHHRLIVSDPVSQWQFTERATGLACTLVPQAHLRVNEKRLAVHMAASGVGVVYGPETQMVDELRDGHLVQVLTDWEAEKRTIYAIWPQSRLMPARVRVLLDHLVEYAGAHPLLNAEAAPSMQPEPCSRH